MRQKDKSLVLHISKDAVNATGQKGKSFFLKRDKDNRIQRGVFICIAVVMIISFFVVLYLKVTLFR